MNGINVMAQLLVLINKHENQQSKQSKGKHEIPKSWNSKQNLPKTKNNNNQKNDNKQK